jgi:hypothetical protein
MTPKEKAIELYHKYFSMIQIVTPIDKVSSIPYVKKCALIAVDEIIKADPTNPLISGYFELYSDMLDEAIKYWQEVKQEIEKL